MTLQKVYAIILFQYICYIERNERVCGYGMNWDARNSVQAHTLRFLYTHAGLNKVWVKNYFEDEFNIILLSPGIVWLTQHES